MSAGSFIYQSVTAATIQRRKKIARYEDTHKHSMDMHTEIRDIFASPSMIYTSGLKEPSPFYIMAGSQI